MAPRKPTSNPKSQKASVKKQGDNRVVKRPARGYHTFRNGMLNVTPKGGEKELVKANQESPLLRLPPEIRNRIWAYALGGKVIRQVFTRRKCVLLPKPQERINAFTLLAACRQIYVETAVLPFAANTVSIRSCYWLSVERRRLRIGLRSQITELSVEISTSRLVKSGGAIESIEVTKLALFPGLKRVRFCLFPVEDWQNISCPEGETLLRSLFEQELSANGYGMLVEKMDMSLSEFIQRWQGDAEIITG